MKRIGNLYQEIISVRNLELADMKARKGKERTYGVRVHDRNRKANIDALHMALLTKTYKTSKYDVFTIFEPKERKIFRLPYYPDRIVHHAIMNVLEPIWLSVFTHNTFSCIKNRGIEGCARSVAKNIQSFRDCDRLYCLKIDIRKFYPSIDHQVLKGTVRLKLKDADLLWLLDEIIDSVEGLPIGNYLSQYLANLILAYFMHWCNEELPKLIARILIQRYGKLLSPVRLVSDEYADDIAYFSDSKEVLHIAFPLIRDYLDRVLHLKVKDNWQIFPIAESVTDKHGRPLDYVGYKFYRRHKLLRRRIKKNFCRKVAVLNKRNPVPELKDYKQQVAPWLGWAKHSNSKNLLKTIIYPDYYGKL